MYLSLIDTKETLSAKLPSTIIDLMKDSTFNITLDMLKDKTTLHNLVAILLKVNIDVVIRDANNEERLYNVYSVHFTDKSGYIAISPTDANYSKRSEFNFEEKYDGEKRIDCPTHKYGNLKNLWVAIYTQYLGL